MFAVAVSTDAIGVVEDKALIKDYFVINPNVPLFAAPGDTFKVTATAATKIKGSGKTAKVAFSCQTSAHLNSG